MIASAAWWITIQIFGIAALPLARRVFAWLPDRGYAFSKVTGLLLVSYLLWLGASAGVLINNAGGILLALLLVAGFSLTLALRSPQTVGARLRTYWRENRAQILVVEILFLLAFAGWTVVRAYAPDKILPAGGEKYMEIAFLNGVLNSPRFPPLDPWMAGYSISYYYFGYVMMAVMVRITAVAPTVGFDLYDALLFALTAITAYGVVANLVRASFGASGGRVRPRLALRSATVFGLLGALLVGMTGNWEGLLEGLYASGVLPSSFWQWLDIPDLAGSAQSGMFYPGHGWWWWRASRVLRDYDLFGKPVVFQPIDEFPFFSFLLGDNHPHKLALPFVLLTIGLAFNLLLRQSEKRRMAGDTTTGQLQFTAVEGWRFWAKRAWHYLLGFSADSAGLYLFYAITLGGLAFLNTWDFPIYLGLVMLAFALGERRAVLAKASGGEAPLTLILIRAVALGIGLGAASILLYGYFYLGFSSQAGGILPYIFPPTRLAQYLVMFGPFITILAFFLPLAARRSAARGFPWHAVMRAWAWVAGLSLGIFLLALLLGLVILQQAGQGLRALLQSWTGGLNTNEILLRILALKAANPWLFLALSMLVALAAAALLRKTNPSRTDPEVSSPDQVLRPAADFALLLAFTGLVLTLVVEFLYLRDNFGMRMNTIFKFYFQCWVMMACASAYGAWWVSTHANRVLRSISATAAALAITAGLVYTLMGVYSRVEGFRNRPNLDAAATFAGFYPGHWAAQPDDWEAVQWLRANGRLSDGSVPIILEAGAGGYENAGRISAFTGFPTLLGWTNHEGQWRGSQEQISQRAPVISTIYTTASAEEALDLLHTWNVRYLILGDTERAYITRICQQPATTCNPNRAEEKFQTALIPVFEHGGTTIYRVPPPAPPAPVPAQ